MITAFGLSDIKQYWAFITGNGRNTVLA